MAHKFNCFLLMTISAAAILVLTAPIPSGAQEAQPSYSGSLWERSTLTGDWGCARNELARKGITFKSTVTNIYQGNFTDGRDGDTYWRYSGSADYEMNLDFGKLGLWQRGFLKVRGLTGFRNSINSKAGSILPVNSDALFPTPDGKDTGLTDFQFIQFLSQSFGLHVGKTNTLGGDANVFAHDYNKQFLNVSMVVNPVTFRTVPYSGVGAGALYLNEVMTYTFTVIDTEGSATKSGSGTVFNDGTTVASELRFKTCIAGLPGHQLFGGTWSNKKFTNLDQDGRLILRKILLPNRDIPLKTFKDSWCFYYNMDHYLFLKEGSTDQGLGVFARYGVSDGKANPIKYFASFGIGGKGLIPGRGQDTFGAGYYHAWFSNQLPNIVYKRYLHGNEQGMELYYNVSLTPWMHLTPDLQIIEPGFKRVDSPVVVGGVRLVLDL